MAWLSQLFPNCISFAVTWWPEESSGQFYCVVSLPESAAVIKRLLLKNIYKVYWLIDWLTDNDYEGTISSAERMSWKKRMGQWTNKGTKDGSVILLTVMMNNSSSPVRLRGRPETKGWTICWMKEWGKEGRAGKDWLILWLISRLIGWFIACLPTHDWLH